MIGTLAGQCGIVTGACTEWGRAIALELARDGARLAIGYRGFRSVDLEGAERLAREAVRLGGEALPLRIPSETPTEHSDHLMPGLTALIAYWGRLDFVVDLDADSLVSRAALRPMLENNRGHMIVVRSAWISGIPFARRKIREFARRGVAVNCVATGHADRQVDRPTRLDGRTPVGTVAPPQDLAATVYFLLSQGSCITGQVIDLGGVLDDAPSNYASPIWTRLNARELIDLEPELVSRGN